MRSNDYEVDLGSAPEYGDGASNQDLEKHGHTRTDGAGDGDFITDHLTPQNGNIVSASVAGEGVAIRGVPV